MLGRKERVGSANCADNFDYCSRSSKWEEQQQEPREEDWENFAPRQTSKSGSLDRAPAPYVNLGDVSQLNADGRAVLTRGNSRVKPRKSPTKYHHRVPGGEAGIAANADRKPRSSVKSTVCVCGASAHYEREKIQLERMKRQLKTDATRLDAELEHLERDKSLVNERMDEVERQNRIVAQSRSNLENERSEIDRLWGEFREREREVRGVESQLDKREKSVLKKQKELQRLRSEYDELVATQERHQHEVEERARDVEDQAAEVKAQETALAQRERDLRSREDKLAQEQTSLDERRRMILQREHTLNEELTGLEEARSELETRREALKTQEEEASALLEELQTKDRQAQRIIDEEKLRSDQLTKQDREMKSRHEAKQRELAAQKRELELQRADILADQKLKAEWWQSNNEEIENLRRHTEDELEKKKNLLEDARSDIEQKRSQVAQLFDQLKTDKQALHDRMRELDKRDTQLLKTEMELQKKLAEAQNSIKNRESALEEKLRQIESDYQVLEEQTGHLEDKWAEYEGKCLELERKEKMIDADLLNKRESWDNLDREHAEAAERLADRQKELDMKYYELADKSNILCIKENELSALQARLEAKQAELDKFNQERQQLEQRINSLNQLQNELTEKEQSLNWERGLLKTAQKMRGNSREPSPSRKRSFSSHQRRAPLDKQTALPDLLLVNPTVTRGRQPEVTRGRAAQNSCETRSEISSNRNLSVDIPVSQRSTDLNPAAAAPQVQKPAATAPQIQKPVATAPQIQKPAAAAPQIQKDAPKATTENLIQLDLVKRTDGDRLQDSLRTQPQMMFIKQQPTRGQVEKALMPDPEETVSQAEVDASPTDDLEGEAKEPLNDFDSVVGAEQEIMNSDRKDSDEVWERERARDEPVVKTGSSSLAAKTQNLINQWELGITTNEADRQKRRDSDMARIRRAEMDAADKDLRRKRSDEAREKSAVENILRRRRASFDYQNSSGPVAPRRESEKSTSGLPQWLPPMTGNLDAPLPLPSTSQFMENVTTEKPSIPARKESLVHRGKQLRELNYLDGPSSENGAGRSRTDLPVPPSSNEGAAFWELDQSLRSNCADPVPPSRSSGKLCSNSESLMARLYSRQPLNEAVQSLDTSFVDCEDGGVDS